MDFLWGFGKYGKSLDTKMICDIAALLRDFSRFFRKKGKNFSPDILIRLIFCVSVECEKSRKDYKPRKLRFIGD